MLKFTTLVLFSLLSFLGLNSLASDSTKYILEVHLYDKFSETPVSNAKIIVTIDLQEYKSAQTDSNGKAQIPLTPKTDFTIKALVKGYLEANFQITTRNKTSTKIIHSIGLSPLCAPRYNYHLQYNHNQYFPMDTSSTTDFMNQNDLLAYLKTNPSLVIELMAFRSLREDSLISSKRAQNAMNYLVSQGIHPNRIITTDAGSDKYGNGISPDIFKLDSNKYLEISRTVDIRILRDDNDSNYAFVDSSYFHLDGEILDHKTKKNIPYCSIYLLDNHSKLISQFQTDSLGAFNWFINLDSLVENESGNNYSFTSYKKGYLPLNRILDYNMHWGRTIKYSNNMNPDTGILETPIIKFNYNKYKIEHPTISNYSLTDSLDYITYRLQKHPKLEISIIGNQLKTEKKNTSTKRIQSVYSYLIAHGVTKEQLHIIDAGAKHNSQEIRFRIVFYEFIPPN